MNPAEISTDDFRLRMKQLFDLLTSKNDNGDYDDIDMHHGNTPITKVELKKFTNKSIINMLNQYNMKQKDFIRKNDSKGANEIIIRLRYDDNKFKLNILYVEEMGESDLLYHGNWKIISKNDAIVFLKVFNSFLQHGNIYIPPSGPSSTVFNYN